MFASLLFISMLFFSSCLTSKKFDKFVAGQYNDQLPTAKKKTDITVSNSSPASSNISTTKPHTKILPLVVYWQFDSRHICDLNSQIAVANFTNTINSMAGKGLSQQLNGQKLELTVEKAPASFALVEKMHVVWLLYSVHWGKVYIEPDFKDLVVSYKLSQNDNVVKTGKIVVKNSEDKQHFRLFQSWKSATSEYLTNYDTDVSRMTRAFVNKLMQEI